MEKRTAPLPLIAALFFFAGVAAGFLLAPIRHGIHIQVCNNGNQAPDRANCRP